jgi:hypothetical protein
MGLLKPNITPDGMIAPCCGVQFASNPPMLDFTRFYSIGTVKEIEKVYEEQRIFDGTKCMRCFYTYNDVIGAIWDGMDLKHKNFI